MTSNVASFRRLCCPAILGCQLWATTPPCHADVFPSALPVMSGIGEAPKSVAMGGQVKYVISQKDKDTNAGNQQFVDVTCNMMPDDINSMIPGTVVYSLRGLDPMTETFLWDVQGTAVGQPGIKVDSWRCVNNRLPADIYRDTDIVASQQITVTGPPPP